MSDKKKGFQPPSTSGSGASGSAAGSTPTGSTPAPGSSGGASSGSTPAPGSSGGASSGGASSGGAPSSRRTARRSAPVRVSSTQSPLETYRFPIILGALVVGLLALGAVFMQTATAAPYTCTTLMTPQPAALAPSRAPEPTTAPATAAPAASVDPAASPAATPTPEATPRLGFAAQDMGQGHVSESTSVTYAYCPPTSGQHFSSANAPLARRFYGPSDSVRPGNWVHNLEHGYAVILYKGKPDADTLAQLRTIMDEAPGTDFTTQQCGLPNKVIVARFDDMTTPFAAVSWDHALLLTEFDPGQLATYVQQSQETDVWPEKGVC